MGMLQDQPDISAAKKKRAQERAPKHDALHMKYETCYCRNECCWYEWEHVRADKTKVTLGICICSECPCKSPRISGMSSAF